MVETDRRLRALAGAVTAGALLLTVAALALHLSWAGRVDGLDPLHSGDVVLATLYPLAGLLVLWHRPRNPAGWVLLSAALVAVSLLAHQWSEIGLREPGSLPLVPLAVWLSAWTFVPYWAQPSLATTPHTPAPAPHSAHVLRL
ncbi:MAG: integral rane sensor signal transduction histidine kinase, partial [Frankiales bacterium]|nr:integral rane sensor signal transduction histidine kinase [Frankiales bacterium]